MRAGEVDPRVLDALLGVGIAMSVALLILADPGRVDPEPAPAVAYLFAVGFGLLMAIRRRFSRLVLVLTVAGVFVYYALGFPPIGIALPGVAALYSASEQGHPWWSAAWSALLIGVAAYFRIAEGQPTAYLLGYELLTNVALAAAAIALGVSVRTRRRARAQAERIAALTSAEQQYLADQRLQTERVQIARDVHDVVGHTLSVVAVHANVADEAIGHDDEAAHHAVAQIRATTAETMGELRATVRLLRDPGTVAPGLAGLARLTDPAREAGLEVGTEVDVPEGALSGAIDAAAYRIVQESLTNVLRHARAHRVEISAEVADGRLHLSVVDDGVGAGRDAGSAAGAGGHGIAGMSERANLLGGTLTARPRQGGGFAVHAHLPARLDR
ncbi:sensor histidine kinase [Occultella glacieicola]|uniref:histidine kinase n=1 Tax=Occultella glacieicola TaxID=2518684 RepID=A0ABY2E8P7_9MICO|nr:histidine kinase [Occultella glacieicola]TDE98868.1 sensor histidine kinase [Occultella glacieicola]